MEGNCGKILFLAFFCLVGKNFLTNLISVNTGPLEEVKFKRSTMMPN